MKDATFSFFKFLLLAIASVLFVSFFLVHVAQFETAKGTAEVQTLDAEALKQNIANRMNAMGRAPDQPMISPDNISIEMAEPVQFDGADLFAVRVSDGSPAARFKSMSLLVDHSGRYNFSEIVDMSTGKSVTEKAMDKISRVSLPENLGFTLFKGQGQHEVVLVANPVNPQAQAIWKMLMAHAGSVKELRLVNLPFAFDTASEIATGILAYAEKNNIKPMETASFAYSEIKPAPRPADEAQLAQERRNMMQFFLDNNPELRARLGDDPDKAIDALGEEVNSVVQEQAGLAVNLGAVPPPCVFVDGLLLKGPTLARLGELLR